MVRAAWWQAVKQLVKSAAGRAPGRRWCYRPRAESLEGRLAPAVTLSITNPIPFPKPDTGQLRGMFVVMRSGDLMATVQVAYQTQDGTGPNGAHAGVDYVTSAGTLMFMAMQTTATISVPILGNNLFQADKTFTVSLSSPQSSAADFTPQQTFTTGPEPQGVAVGDFNGDGKPDLAIANYGFLGRSVSVLLNTTPAGATTPSFAPQQTFAVGGNAVAVAVGDFNGDGKPDLAVTNQTGGVGVLLNTTPTGSPTVTFAPPQTFASGRFPGLPAVGDFNDDGEPDLAFTNGNFNNVSVLLNTSVVLSGSPAMGTISSAPEAPTAIAVVAATTPQLAAVNTAFAIPLAVDIRGTSGTLVQGVRVTFTAPVGGASGTFGGSSSVTVSSNTAGRAMAPTFVATIVVGSYTVTAQAVGGSNPTTSFNLTNLPGPPASLTANAGGNQSALVNTLFASALVATLTDPYGNAIPGVTVTFVAPASGASARFTGGNTGTTAANGQVRKTVTANPLAGSYTVTAQVAGGSNPSTSFRLTNKLPYFAVGGAPGLVQIRRDSDGSLLTEFAPYGPGYTGAINVALGDVNGDGVPDLVTAPAAGNPDLRVYDGAALLNGPFDPANPNASLLAQWFAYALSFNLGATVAVGDIEHTGFADIVTGASAGNPQVNVYRGQDIARHTFDPTGASVVAQWFAYPLNLNLGANVAVGDVEGNGFVDIVTGASAGNPGVRVFRGRDIADHMFSPNGTSVVAQWFAFGLDFNIGATVAVGDVNGDGFGDVIVGAAAGKPQVKVYDGQAMAQGTFSYATPDRSLLNHLFAYDRLNADVGVSVAAADFENTGRDDILTGPMQAPASVRVVPGRATGIMPPAVNGIDLVAADLTDGVSVGA